MVRTAWENDFGKSSFFRLHVISQVGDYGKFIIFSTRVHNLAANHHAPNWPLLPFARHTSYMRYDSVSKILPV